MLGRWYLGKRIIAVKNMYVQLCIDDRPSHSYKYDATSNSLDLLGSRIGDDLTTMDVVLSQSPLKIVII